MASHVRRFTDMHSAVVMVPIDLPESIIIREKKNRRVDSRDSLSKSRASIRIAVVRDSHLNSSSESLWR